MRKRSNHSNRVLYVTHHGWGRATEPPERAIRGDEVADTDGLVKPDHDRDDGGGATMPFVHRQKNTTDTATNTGNITAAANSMNGTNAGIRTPRCDATVRSIRFGALPI